MQEIEAVLNEHIDSLVALAEKEAAEELEQALEPPLDVSLMPIHLTEESCTTIEQV